MLRGRCLCGSITYEIDGDPIVVAHCHCTDCKRLSGAGHATGAMFPVDKVRVSGATSEFRVIAESGNTVTRTFCPTCGSPLFGRNTAMEGTLDDPGAVTPQVVIFARNRAPWDAMDDALPTFEAQPGWKPEDGV